MDKLLFKRILISILVVCMISYVIYLFVGLKGISSIETENVVYTITSDVITTEGFVVRDETLIKNSESGVMSYNVSDGENINVGQCIADVYLNENDAILRRQIDKIDNQIKSLQELGVSYHTEGVGLDAVNNQIENGIFSMLDNINGGELSEASQKGDTLVYYINERQIITGQTKNFNKKINELRSEKIALKNNYSEKIGTIKSPVAGYFITSVDGYERNFKYEDVAKITLDEYDGISHAEYTNNYAGKIVKDPEWYIVCKIKKEDSLILTNLYGKGISINIKIPFVTSQSLPTEIVAVNQNANDDEGILVLSCDYMSEDISKARIEDIEIELGTFKGLKVSKRAIVDDYVTKVIYKDNKQVEKKKKVQGVYVLHGTEIKFKEIDISYSSKDYVICNPAPDEGVLFNGKTVSLYDRVVIKGENLYDGKIIE